MRFSIQFPFNNLYMVDKNHWRASATHEVKREVAQLMDNFDYISVSDHVVMGYERAATMGSYWMDCIAAMSWLLGVTEKASVYTSVMVPAYRHPIMLAKQLSTMDDLSGGRVVLGAGVGHQIKEFELFGVPYEKRGKLTDELIAAMRILWSEEDPEFNGEFFQFDEIKFDPKPLKKSVPVWIGGDSKLALRRAARLGTGWVPWQIRPNQLPECIDYIREQPGFEERMAKEEFDFEVILPTIFVHRESGTQRKLGETLAPRNIQEMIEFIAINEEAGATITSLQPFGGENGEVSKQAYMDGLQELIEEVLPHFKG
ncbi:TIGR03619 family F420-dependent LLM class oxidoreductase [Halieaceae bacterium]|jgi:probable F420-dependent oxidoreductase|nr:TIGR03619 family F420-dependent LLM class oxidoreductase [Halieaceae bacterium]